MKTSRWTIEHTLYLLAFLLALGVRLLRLGAAALPDFEAGWALQALQISGQHAGDPLSLGPNPGYGMVTGLLFFLMGSSNGLARLWPAIAGALLSLLPAFFRRELGQKAALILAFGLALDPGLVAVSRTAGEGMPALAFGLLALGAAYHRRAILAGILGGLALISGPTVLTGIVGLFLTWGVIRLFEKSGILAPWVPSGGEDTHFAPQEHLEGRALAPSDATLNGEVSASPPETIEKEERNRLLRLGVYFLVGTALLVGTLFFRFPQGLGALAETLTAYLVGWVDPSGVPALRLPAALLIYQPLPLIFGLVGAIQGWRRNHPSAALARRLSLWAIVALLASMIYPARQISDLIWVLVPLWALAALELADSLALEGEAQNRYIVAGQAVLLLILLAFTWNFLLVARNPGQLQNLVMLRNIVLLSLGVVGMGALTTLLVSLGWSWSVARRGLAWGISIALGLSMLSGMWKVSQGRAAGEQELWSRLPACGETELFINTLSDLSQWHTGHRNTLDVMVLAESPSLRWALRSWPNVRYASNLSPNQLPSVILTYQGQEPPALMASYRGQDFPWEIYPAWQGILPPDLPRWLTTREASLEQNQVIVWARADLFPGGMLEPQAEIQIIPEEEPLP